MKSKIRSFVKWTVRLLITLLILIAIWISAIAFPQPFFEFKKHYDNITVYSDKAFDPEFDSIMTDVRSRLNFLEIYDSNISQDVFYCHSEKLFLFCARIRLQPPDLQGFNISALNHNFISATRINNLVEYSGGFPKFNIHEGSPAHIIVHEIVHDYFVNELGFWETQKIPYWKSEGCVEYCTNIYIIKKDAVSIIDRIEIMTNDSNWDPGANHARNHYQWELMIEYLSENLGYTFNDIMQDSVKFDETYSKMIEWYKKKL